MAGERRYIPASEFCASVRDGTHDSPKEVAQGRKLVTSRHLTTGRLDLSDAYLISEEDFEAINKRSKVDRWDVLISMIGTVGEPCLIKEKPNFAIKNIGLFKTKSEADGKWLYYFLRSKDAQQSIRAHSRGTTQQYIPLGALREFPILVADDPKEQKAIAAVLGALDDKIELNRRMNATLEAMARALFQSWFVDFDPIRAKLDGREPTGLDPATAALFPNEFEESELGHIPKGWRTCTLCDIAKNVSVTFDFNRAPEMVFINTGDVLEGDFLHSKRSPHTGLPGQAKKSIQPDDILFSEIRPANKRYAYVDFDSGDYVVSTKFMIIRGSNEIHPRLLYRILSAKETLDEFQVQAESRSGTFPQITFDSISHLPIVLAPIEIQSAFQRAVGDWDAQIKVNKQQSRTLASVRDTLLPNLLSGDMRVSLNS
jgi:type I restriction enzyme S subunit